MLWRYGPFYDGVSRVDGVYQRKEQRSLSMEVVDVLTERLKMLMEEHQIKAAPLARAADLNESAVRDILRGRSKNPGIVTLQKIAAVLNLRPSALFEAGVLWPVLGAVSDGGVVHSCDSGEFLENPFFASTPNGLAALRVEGDGLAPFAFSGDFLIFHQDATSPHEAVAQAGKPRFCVLADGKKVIRILKPGGDAITLLPVNPYTPAEIDTQVASTHVIAFVVPGTLSAITRIQTHQSTTSVHEAQKAFSPKE